MRKLIFIVLAVAMLAASLTACSTGLKGKTTTATEAPSATEAAPSATATPEATAGIDIETTTEAEATVAP